jgi:hypothetical protein
VGAQDEGRLSGALVTRAPGLVGKGRLGWEHHIRLLSQGGLSPPKKEGYWGVFSAVSAGMNVRSLRFSYQEVRWTEGRRRGSPDGKESRVQEAPENRDLGEVTGSMEPMSSPCSKGGEVRGLLYLGIRVAGPLWFHPLHKTKTSFESLIGGWPFVSRHCYGWLATNLPDSGNYIWSVGARLGYRALRKASAAISECHVDTWLS